MKILVITTREIGDVLLSTPLIHSLKKAYPDALIDALVFNNKQGMLSGNPDIRQILTIDERPSMACHYALFKQIWRAYDLSISTLSGDRPIFYAMAAAKQRVAPLGLKNKKNFWKHYFCQTVINLPVKPQHTILQNFMIAESLKIKAIPQLITPISEKATVLPASNYMVLHVLPRWKYKRWSITNWQHLAQQLQSIYACSIVLTGGSDLAEQAYVATVASQIPASINLAARLDLGQVTPLLQQARLYVGPDTAITHLAAACCPTVALFGPTNPEIWSPWPKGWDQRQSPFKKVGSAIVANIALVQGQGNCVPCHKEGCDQHKQSHSRCLDQLSVDKVLFYIKQLLKN